VASQRLQHGDRVLVGMHHYYLYCDPVVDENAMVDWETAMKEANKEAMNSVNQDNEELEKYRAEAEKLKKEQEEKEQEMKGLEEKLEAQRKQ
jgi:septal ring factor EnvC (AmiA/AmiB activator)